MSNRILVATRKGLLTLARSGDGWSVSATDFPGVPVTAVLRDARDGTLYAALKHGHFGPKLHRSADDGRTWQEIATPAFPADAAGAPALFQLWTIEAGGAEQPGRLWAGATVGDALADVFAREPQVRAYVLDEQGRLRRHITVFVDGRMIRDREGLSDPVGEASEVRVMQALSGGE